MQMLLPKFHMHGWLSASSLTDVNESDIYVQWNEVKIPLQIIRGGEGRLSLVHPSTLPAPVGPWSCPSPTPPFHAAWAGDARIHSPHTHTQKLIWVLSFHRNLTSGDSLKLVCHTAEKGEHFIPTHPWSSRPPGLYQPRNLKKNQDTVLQQGMLEVELFNVVTRNQCRAPGKSVCNQRADAEHCLNQV